MWADVAEHRVAERPERRLEAERVKLERHRRREAIDDLVGRDDDDEPRSRPAATIFSRVWAAPPPFTSQPSGVTWSAPSTARSSLSRVSNGSTSRPSSRAALLGRGRRRHAADGEASRGQRRQEVPDRRARAQADGHPGLDQLGRGLGREALFVVRGHRGTVSG